MATQRASAPGSVPSSLLEAYERTLATSRGLAPATLRNYLADVGPFFEYLSLQGLQVGARLEGLRRFIERDGAPRVAQEYRSMVRDYVSWMLGDRRLGSGRRAGQRGHERGSVVRTLAALRSFMRYAIDRRLMPDAALWDRRSTLMRRFTPRPPQRLPDVVSATEASRLMDAPGYPSASGSRAAEAARSRDHALLEILYGAGLRVSEVTGLDIGDVALESRTARVLGKGSKARMVPLGKIAIDALASYTRDARPALVGPASDHALFLNQRGGRLTQRSVQHIVRRYAASAGLRDGLHPHTLRHSFATHLLDGGADLRIVQELLGHSTPSATQVYTHVSQNEARRVYLAAHPMARDVHGAMARSAPQESSDDNGPEG